MWNNILDDFRDFASDYFHRRILSAESLGKAYCLSSKTLRLPYGNYGDPVWYPSIEDFLTPEELEQKRKEENEKEEE